MKIWLQALFKDSIVYGIGYGVSRFLQLIVLPIIAHSLSLSEYGYYSNYVIFYTIAGGVFVLGLDSSAAHFFYDSDDKKYHRKLFSMTFFGILSISLAFVLLFVFFPSFILKAINVPNGYRTALPYVLFTIPLLSLNSFLLSWFKWRRRKIFFLINAISVVLLMLVPLLVIRPISFLIVFKTIFFSQLIVVCISSVLALEYLRLVFDGALFIRMLKYGFPWMLVFFLGLSRSYIDRFFLTRYLNDSSYGIYNFSTRLSTLLSLFLTAFDMSFGPLALSIWNKPEAPGFFARLQSIYTLLISIAAVFITIFSPLLIAILGGEKYRGAEMVLPFLLFSAIPLSLINFSSIGMVYSKRSFLNTITVMVGFVVVLLLNFILTPMFFEYGAVNASVIGHLFIAATGYYFSHKYYKIPFSFGKDGLIFLCFLLMSVASVQLNFSANAYVDVLAKTVTFIGIVFFVSFFFFKEEFQKMLNLLRNFRRKHFALHSAL